MRSSFSRSVRYRRTWLFIAASAPCPFAHWEFLVNIIHRRPISYLVNASLTRFMDFWLAWFPWNHSTGLVEQVWLFLIWCGFVRIRHRHEGFLLIRTQLLLASVIHLECTVIRFSFVLLNFNISQLGLHSWSCFILFCSLGVPCSRIHRCSIFN